MAKIKTLTITWYKGNCSPLLMGIQKGMSTWKTVGKILPHDPAAMFLGIHPHKLKNDIHKNMNIYTNSGHNY
jgi:hypothetical protein